MSNLSNNNDSGKHYRLTFNPVAIPPAIDPEGGYTLVPQLQVTKSSLATCQEIKTLLGLSLTPQQLHHVFSSAFLAALELCRTDCQPRMIGDIKLVPVMSGKLTNAYDQFDATKNKIVIRITFSRTANTQVDASTFLVVNALTGPRLTLSKVRSKNSTTYGQITRGDAIIITGLYLQINEDDRVTFSWTQDSAAKSVTGVVSSSDLERIECEWMSELDSTPIGTEITITVSNHGDGQSSEMQTKSITVLLAEAAEIEG